MTELPFQGRCSFLKGPSDGNLPFRFLGVPFDLGSSFRPGAALGPEAIRAASKMLTDGPHPEYDVDPSRLVADFGDIPASSVNVERALGQIEDAVRENLDTTGVAPVLLLAGGNHLVTLPILRAYRAVLRTPLALVHFDAHCDTWSDHFGDPIGHGTFLRNALDEGLIDPEKVISLGIRSPADAGSRDYLATRGGGSVSARTLHANDIAAVGRYIRQKIGADHPCYITFDIDFLDPAYAPGTGTPEVGGFSTHQALMLLEELRALNIVGADVVEVNPMVDQSQITALAAATILWTIVAMRGKR